MRAGTALLIEDLLGSKTFIGTGSFAMMGGTALGAMALTRWVGRRRRRPVLVSGYVIGALGGLPATAPRLANGSGNP